MNRVKKKLNGNSGLTLLLAMILLLVSVTVSTVILTTALSSVRSTQSDREGQQAYLTVSSAVEMFRDGLNSCQANVSYEAGEPVLYSIEKKGIVTGSTDLEENERYVYDKEAENLFKIDGDTSFLQALREFFSDMDSVFHEEKELGDAINSFGKKIYELIHGDDVIQSSVKGNFNAIAGETDGSTTDLADLKEYAIQRSGMDGSIITDNFADFLTNAVAVCDIASDGTYHCGGGTDGELYIQMGDMGNVYVDFTMKKTSAVTQEEGETPAEEETPAEGEEALEEEAEENGDTVETYSIQATFSLSNPNPEAEDSAPDHDCKMYLTTEIEKTSIDTEAYTTGDGGTFDQTAGENAVLYYYVRVQERVVRSLILRIPLWTTYDYPDYGFVTIVTEQKVQNGRTYNMVAKDILVGKGDVPVEKTNPE